MGDVTSQRYLAGDVTRVSCEAEGSLLRERASAHGRGCAKSLPSFYTLDENSPPKDDTVKVVLSSKKKHALTAAFPQGATCAAWVSIGITTRPSRGTIERSWPEISVRRPLSPTCTTVAGAASETQTRRGPTTARRTRARASRRSAHTRRTSDSPQRHHVNKAPPPAGTLIEIQTGKQPSIVLRRPANRSRALDSGPAVRQARGCAARWDPALGPPVGASGLTLSMALNCIIDIGSGGHRQGHANRFGAADAACITIKVNKSFVQVKEPVQLTWL